MTYAVVSDIHAHAWNLFSTTLDSGVNSRLQVVLDELRRTASTLRAKGGKSLIVAGDVFHKREFLDQEVLNPVRAVFREIAESGITVVIIPGNHDLKSEETCELSSSVQNLRQSTAKGSVHVVNEPKMIALNGYIVGLVPWRPRREDLLADMEALSKHGKAAEADVFIHAGIDGVLSGVPANGLTASDLAAFGFRRVFAGHYHHHKDMGSGVYSIGATTHHNWGDIGTLAGFLTVDESSVEFHDTQAPKFIDISGMSEDDMELEVPGNYARFRGPQMSQEDINAFRRQLRDWGAKGVSIEVPRAVVAARAPASSGKSLAESLRDFVRQDKNVPQHLDRDKISARAEEVLTEVQSVTEDA